MRTRRALAIAVTSIVALAACSGGGDDDGPRAGRLNAEEQRYADAFAAKVTNDPGVPVSADAGTCIGEAVVHELGLRPFHDAKVEPEDILGDATIGQLLGAGRALSEEQGAAVAATWDTCADMTATFSKRAQEQLGLDDVGGVCLTGKLQESDAIRRYLALRLTTDDREVVQGVLDEIQGHVEQCARESGQAARVVDAIAASITADGKVGPTDAHCLAEHVVEAIGVVNLLQIGSAAGFAAASPDVRRNVAQQVLDAEEACGVQLEAGGSAGTG